MNGTIALSGVIVILAISSAVMMWQMRALSQRLLDERRYSVLESIPDGIFIVDDSWRFTHVNERAETMLNASAATLVGRRLDHVFDPLASELLPELRKARKSGEPLERTQYFPASRRWIEIRIQPAAGESLVYLRDVSDRKRAENQVRDSERRLRLLLEQVPALLWTIDLDHRVTSVQGTGLAYHGIRGDDLVGESIERLLSPGESEAGLAAVERVLRGESERFEAFFNERWMQHHVEPLRTTSGAVIGAIGVALDITEIKETAENLARLARVDSLTQLPNRLALQEAMPTALEAAQAGRTGLGVLFIDLDRFKMINDTLGHYAGDELLKQFAERLEQAVDPRCRVYRSGGDEFIVLARLDESLNAPMVAADVQRALAEPFYVAERQLHVSASIGASVFPGDGTTVEELLTRADSAMYRSKYYGRARPGFGDPLADDAAAYRLRLEQDLHYAIDRGELSLVFQPIVDVPTQKMIGAEALLRWNHTRHGEILPEEFIGIAEESGMIVTISRWVLRNACQRAMEFRLDGHPEFRIAVNMSARDFGEVDLADRVQTILDETGLPAHALEIEITEQLMIDDVALMTMRTLRQMGIRIVVDDFGVAYSSLGYLKRLPISGLKIDRTFIRDCASDGYDRAIVQAIVALARSLDLEIIAEGVESCEQWQFIHSLQCDRAQGYRFGRPVNPETLRTAPLS